MRGFTASIKWACLTDKNKNAPPLVLLHGFSQGPMLWGSIPRYLAEEFSLYRFHLPGHGATPIPKQPITLSRLADELAEYMKARIDSPVNLLGYSMGGRLAMHIATQHSELVRKLVLIGASPGIADATEREARMRFDRDLARKIRDRGTEWFYEYWDSLPIFATRATLPVQIQRAMSSTRASNTAEGLAFALENWSPGLQANLCDLLANLAMPILLIAGAQDKKYSEANRRIEQAGGANLRRLEIANAGHAPQLEAPHETADILRTFLINQE